MRINPVNLWSYRNTQIILYHFSTAFGKIIGNKQQVTMVPMGKTPLQVGQSADGGLSPYDIVELKKLYSCKENKATKPKIFKHIKTPHIYIISADLKAKIEIFMRAFKNLNNIQFTAKLRDYLFMQYPSHYFLILTYNAMDSTNKDKQAFVGYCEHKYNYYGRNCIVCHSSKKSKFGTKEQEVSIWQKIAHFTKDKEVRY